MLTAFTSPCQSRPGSNNNEELLHNPQNSRTNSSPPEAVCVILKTLLFWLSVWFSDRGNTQHILSRANRAEYFLTTKYWVFLLYWESSGSVMDKMLDCSHKVSEFKPHSCYYIHFRANTIGKDLNAFIRPSMG